jgi:uncharacterized protein
VRSGCSGQLARSAPKERDFGFLSYSSYARPMELSAEGARVIGSLVEKELTTPDQYPLTIKALLSACNQASNRDPVVTYDEDVVMSTLNALKEQRLVRFVLPSHGRSAVRYRHVLPEALALDQRQCALVAVLLLRGPQTIGELRIRTERMTDFDGLDEVEHELEFLSRVEQPLALRLERRPGQKEVRWICPAMVGADAAMAPSGSGGSSAARDDDFGGRGAFESGDRYDRANDRADGRDDTNEEGNHSVRSVDSGRRDQPPTGDVADELRAELAMLRSEVSELRRDLNALRVSLGE